MLKSRQVFVCHCGSPEHQFIVERWVDVDPNFEYLIFHIHLTIRSLWRRLITAFWFVLGTRKHTYAFEEMLLRRPAATQLRDVINVFLAETERVM